MSLIYRDRPKIRIGCDELDGLINAMVDKIVILEDDGDATIPYYLGALIALEIVRYQAYVEYPDDFMRLLDNKLQESIDTEV